MSSPPSLLTIPLELRWGIFEYVLAASPASDELLYENGVIWPIPRVVSLCRQLRYEMLPLYFRNKTIWFSTLGELGSALLLAPSTVPYWKKLHIDWTGRRGWTRDGNRWNLEPGLEMVTKIPNLTHLSVDTDTIFHLLGTDLAEEIGLSADQVQHAIPEDSKIRTLEITGRIDSSLTPDKLCCMKWLDDGGGFKRVYERSGSGPWTLKQSLTQT